MVNIFAVLLDILVNNMCHVNVLTLAVFSQTLYVQSGTGLDDFNFCWDFGSNTGLET